MILDGKIPVLAVAQFVAVLYHVSDRARFALDEWLLERFGVLCFVACCLPVSIIFAGFLSVMLSAFSSWLLMCGLFGLQMAKL